jgi:hypothetical protein
MPELVKFFRKLDMALYYTKPQIKHMQAFVIAMMLRGFCGKMSDISGAVIHTHRTCVGRFLASDAWNDEFLTKALNAYVIEKIWDHSRKTGLPIYAIIDDTICEKAKTSSKALQPIYGTSVHRSHLKDEFVYGHQFVSAMLRCGEMILPFAVFLYEKNGESKIAIAERIIKCLPAPITKGYVLTDSWYSSVSLFKAAQAAGFHYVGAIKSNRKIFPRGYRRKGIQIGAFAHSLKLSDFDKVTVAGRRYYMYTYLGKINGMGKVKIAITFPVNAPFRPHTMKAFISTDFEMSGKQLLHHYTNRWPIEVFFRDANRYLGMKKCQVRSKKAILRYQYLLMLAYAFCGFNIGDDGIVLGKHCKSVQTKIERCKVEWIFQQAQNNCSLESVLQALGIA